MAARKLQTPAGLILMLILVVAPPASVLSKGESEGSKGEECTTPEATEEEGQHRTPLVRSGAELMFPGSFPGFGFDAGRMGSLMRGIQQEMEQALASFLPVSTFGVAPATHPQAAPFLMDVHETEKEVVITADGPGLQKSDVKVSISPEKVLTLRGERKMEEDVKEAGVRRLTRRNAVFFNRIQLPENVDTMHTSARVEHGELVVRVPKVEAPGVKHQEVPVH